MISAGKESKTPLCTLHNARILSEKYDRRYKNKLRPSVKNVNLIRDGQSFRNIYSKTYLTGKRRLLAPTKYCVTVIKRWLRLAKSASPCMMRREVAVYTRLNQMLPVLKVNFWQLTRKEKIELLLQNPLLKDEDMANHEADSAMK